MSARRSIAPEDIEVPAADTGGARPELEEFPHERSEQVIPNAIIKVYFMVILAIFLVLGGLTMYLNKDDEGYTEYPTDKKISTSSSTKGEKQGSVPTSCTGTQQSSQPPVNGSERRRHGAGASGTGYPEENRRTEDICQMVELTDCGNGGSSPWYPVGSDCYQWTQQTQCANSVDSFKTQADCLAACLDGWCSTVEKWTDLRRCLTDDKVHQWFFDSGSCRRLNDSEAACLDGDNRFHSEKQCNDTCFGTQPVDTQCRRKPTLSQSTCAEGKMFPYIFNRKMSTCAPVTFCATTPFSSYDSCMRTCFA